MDIDSRITNATSLEDLLAAMREIEAECRETGDDPQGVYDATDLPTYGGAAPRDTHEIWSWDADRLLVGTCADDMKIVARDA